MGFTDTSLIWRSAFFLTGFGFMFTLAGMASSYMASTELIPNMFMHLGMWDICDDTRSFSCVALDDELIATGSDSDWLHGARAMAVIGIIIMGFIPFISLYLTYTASSNQVASFIIGTTDLLAGIFCSIGGIVFIVFGLDLLESKVEMYTQPSWSFVIYMLGQFFAFSSAAMNFYDACHEDMD